MPCRIKGQLWPPPAWALGIRAVSSLAAPQPAAAANRPGSATWAGSMPFEDPRAGGSQKQPRPIPAHARGAVSEQRAEGKAGVGSGQGEVSRDRTGRVGRPDGRSGSILRRGPPPGSSGHSSKGHWHTTRGCRLLGASWRITLGPRAGEFEHQITESGAQGSPAWSDVRPGRRPAAWAPMQQGCCRL